MKCARDKIIIKYERNIISSPDIEHHVDPYVPIFMLITIYLLQYFRPELRAVGRGVRGDDQLPAVRHGQDAAVHHHLTCRLPGHLLPGRLRGVEVCRRSPAVPRRSNRPAGHQQSGNDKQILKMWRKRIIILPTMHLY